MTHEPPCMLVTDVQIGREGIDIQDCSRTGEQDLIAETDFVQPVYSLSVEKARAKAWARGPTKPAKTLQETYQEQKAAVGFCS